MAEPLSTSVATEHVATSREIKKSIEQPIKTTIWTDAPKVDPKEAIRQRSVEFFGGPEVPLDLKALGLLATEVFVAVCENLESAYFQTALWQETPHCGKPTLYGIQLFSDRLTLVLSPVRDYGPGVTMASIPLRYLDEVTGGIALEIAEFLPNSVNTLLSTEADGVSNELRCQAKLDLMRYLVQEHPDNIRIRGNTGGLTPSVGMSFTSDGQTSILRLDVNEIPSSDPTLGDMAELYASVETFMLATSQLEGVDFSQMTATKIEKFLLTLPNWMKTILMGKNHGPSDAGIKSWKIMRFLKMVGYRGNEQQQQFRKSSNLSLALMNLATEMRGKMLQTIVNISTVETEGLTRPTLDQSFRDWYKKLYGQSLPDTFSITAIVEDRVPLDQVNL